MKPEVLRRLNYFLYFILGTTLWGLYHFFNTQLQPRTPRGQKPHHNISILLWYWPFSRAYSLAGNVCWDLYRVPGCRLHNDHLLFNQADVVVFHHHELKTQQQKLPLYLKRPLAQKWLWMSMESPASNGNLRAYDGIFNWTMSYRRDADIFIPYGKPIPKNQGLSHEDSDNAININKSSLACWVVSNYKSHHKRTLVYQELQKLIKVDVYGRWTKRPLKNENLLPVLSNCYFYLAFENAQFKDYITEKLWRNSFQAGTVPVVLGPPRRNYEDMVPPKSFIHVDDFESVDKLAQFLKQVASNETQYMSYFKWRQDYKMKVFTDWRERLCRICTVYHTLPPNKVYKNLQEWANV